VRDASPFPQRVLLWVKLTARLALAGIFLFAGASKLRDPAAFAVEIGHYELLPELAPYVAIVLPMVEVVVGLALMFAPRLWRRSAALICAVLMAAFTFAASAALVRGLDIDCGCFGGDSGPITWLNLVRDGVLLALCGALLWEPSGAPAHERQEET
jgi:putative oxidoreductase